LSILQGQEDDFIDSLIIWERALSFDDFSDLSIAGFDHISCVYSFTDWLWIVQERCDLLLVSLPRFSDHGVFVLPFIGKSHERFHS
jgi:hypothetical protein